MQQILLPYPLQKTGAGLDRPVIGMLLPNYSLVMKLVEVIAGRIEYTGRNGRHIKVSEEIGKVPVQVEEAADFVVNRV